MIPLNVITIPPRVKVEKVRAKASELVLKERGIRSKTIVFGILSLENVVFGIEGRRKGSFWDKKRRTDQKMKRVIGQKI
jgi:hypothetical protein